MPQPEGGLSQTNILAISKQNACRAKIRKRNKDERVVDGYVDVDLGNVDRDARTDYRGDEGKEDEVLVNRVEGKTIGRDRTRDGARGDNQPHIDRGKFLRLVLHYPRPKNTGIA